MTDIEEPNGETSKRWWRSLDELAGTPGFEEQLHREFPRAASEWDEGSAAGASSS